MGKTTIKIHISRDFSFAEFDLEYDPESGEGLPTRNQLLSIWDRLPEKETNRVPAEDSAVMQVKAKQKASYEPAATANQRRLLEHLGLWCQGLTRAEASKILTEEGY